MMDDLTRDPHRDPALAAALRSLGPEPPAGDVDWVRLREALARRAQSELARRRGGGAWWLYAASWARPAFPAALLAAAALVVAVNLGPGRDPAGEQAAEAVPARLALEEALRDPVLEQDPATSLIYANEGDALLRAAVEDQESGHE